MGSRSQSRIYGGIWKYGRRKARQQFTRSWQRKCKVRLCVMLEIFGLLPGILCALMELGDSRHTFLSGTNFTMDTSIQFYWNEITTRVRTRLKLRANGRRLWGMASPRNKEMYEHMSS